MSISPDSFAFIKMILRERSGHFLEEDKRYLVETRLLPLVRAQGLDSVEQLLLKLRSRPNELILAQVIEAMTINETSFFRDSHPFEVLCETVIPELMRRRSQCRSLTIWSAACSSGQEAYSIAILLRQHFPQLANWFVRLIASDISGAMIERGRTGVYSDLEVSRGCSPEILKAYFQRHGNAWRLRSDILKQVEFCAINLTGIWPTLPMFDLILLRNVLIYFDAPTRQRVLAKVGSVLKPDGFLLLGGAESTVNIHDDLVPVAFGQSCFYQRRGEE